MANYGHAKKDLLPIEVLNLATILTMFYDLDGIENKVALNSCVRKFLHEENKFDDLFAEGTYYGSVLKMVNEDLLV